MEDKQSHQAAIAGQKPEGYILREDWFINIKQFIYI